MITNLNNFVNESLGSSLALPANGLGGSRATSLLVAHFALQNTKFGSEKGKVQNPARIPPQTPPAGGKKAEAGQIQNPRKIVCPAEANSFNFAECKTWRRGRDSNPRAVFTANTLAGCPIRPLWHLSIDEVILYKISLKVNHLSSNSYSPNFISSSFL